MNACITTHFNNGIGSTYDTLYRVHNTELLLRELGYNTQIHVDFGLNPNKMNTPCREVFKQVLNFAKVKNLNLYPHNIDDLKASIKMPLAVNNSNIYFIYADTITDKLTAIENFNSWQYSDSLPKTLMLTDRAIEFAENKLKQYPSNYYCIHYRPHELLNQQAELDKYIRGVEEFILNHKDTPIFVFSQFEIIKDYLNLKKYKNVFFNDFKFPIDHAGIRGLGWSDEVLLNYLFETFFEMYALTKAEKIYRVCPWFSNFLFLSNTFNQTNISNTLRYVPPYR